MSSSPPRVYQVEPSDSMQRALVSVLGLGVSSGLDQQDCIALTVLLRALTTDGIVRHRLNEISSSLLAELDVQLPGCASSNASSSSSDRGKRTFDSMQAGDYPREGQLDGGTQKRVRFFVNHSSDSRPRDYLDYGRCSTRPKVPAVCSDAGAQASTERSVTDLCAPPSPPPPHCPPPVIVEQSMPAAVGVSVDVPAEDVVAAAAAAAAAAAEQRALKQLDSIRRDFARLCASAPPFASQLDFNEDGSLAATPRNRQELQLEQELNNIISNLDAVQHGGSPAVLDGRRKAIAAVQQYQSARDEHNASVFANQRPAQREDSSDDERTVLNPTPERDRSQTAVNRHPSPDEDGESELTDVEVDLGGIAPPGAGAGVRTGGDDCPRASTSAKRSARELVGTSAVSSGRAPGNKKRGSRNKSQPHALSANAPALRPPTMEVLSCLAGISSPMAYGSVVHALQMSWRGQGMQMFPSQDDLPDDNAASLTHHAKQCQEAEATLWLASLRSMLTEMRFAITAQRILNQASDNVSLDALMEKESVRTGASTHSLLQYHAKGMKWAYLFLAGSAPLLIACALLGLRRKLIRMDMGSFPELCACIRDPAKKHAPSYVANIIVPTLVEWGRCFNLRLGQTVFGQDLAADDKILSSLQFNDWILPRRGREWESWDGSKQLTMFQPRPPEFTPRLPIVWSPPARTCRDIITGVADFKKPFSPVARMPRMPSTMTPEERKARNKELRKQFATKERAFAQAHKNVCTSWDDLQAKAPLHGFTELGDYLVIPTRLARETQTDMKFCHSNGAFIAEVLDTSMFSDQELAPLFDHLRDAMRVNPETIPNESNDSYINFPAVHCLISNKYSENGDDNAGPPVAETADELQGNTHQRLPRPQLDLRADLQGYNDVCAVLEKIFRLVAERVKASLPKSYEVLMSYVRALPMGTWSPCYPFAGLVLNFGVMTDPHLDEDLEVCVVITFGKFTGGELGLYEAKLLFEMEGFSIIIFPSAKLTHFNLPFQGQRGSIALATEKASTAWTNSRNAWRQYLYTGKPRGQGRGGDVRGQGSKE